MPYKVSNENEKVKTDLVKSAEKNKWLVEKKFLTANIFFKRWF